jgi:hypothetical protein
MSADTVCFFMTMREQIKLYHWQTKSYSRHKATDALLDELDKHIDMYVEVYMGKHGRPKLSSRTNTIKLANLSETSIQTFIKKCINYLIKEIPKDLQQSDTDLYNIRDEMLAQLHQLQYLFTLH